MPVVPVAAKVASTPQPKPQTMQQRVAYGKPVAQDNLATPQITINVSDFPDFLKRTSTLRAPAKKPVQVQQQATAMQPSLVDTTSRATYPAADDFATRKAALPLLDQYKGYIQKSAKQFGVPEELIQAVILKESAANAKAQSSGQYGLMQIIPKFVDMKGVTNPLNPEQNIMAGTRHLANFLHANNGNLDLALASYNAGPTLVNDLNTGKVTKRNPRGLNTRGIPLDHKVTMSYIPTVKAWMQELKKRK